MQCPSFHSPPEEMHALQAVRARMCEIHLIESQSLSKTELVLRLLPKSRLTQVFFTCTFAISTKLNLNPKTNTTTALYFIQVHMWTLAVLAFIEAAAAPRVREKQLSQLTRSHTASSLYSNNISVRHRFSHECCVLVPLMSLCVLVSSVFLFVSASFSLFHLYSSVPVLSRTSLCLPPTSALMCVHPSSFTSVAAWARKTKGVNTAKTQWENSRDNDSSLVVHSSPFSYRVNVAGGYHHYLTTVL